MKQSIMRCLLTVVILGMLMISVSAALAADSHVVINEVMYNPDPGSDSAYEYIELVNVGPTPVNMNGWTISDNAATDDISAYNPGSPAIIAGGGYAIITDNVTSVIALGGIHLAVDDASIGSGGLSNTGETLVLNNGTIDIDSVTYASADGANGNGSSLECMNPISINDNTGNGIWSESIDGGTPGIGNSNYFGPVLPTPEFSTIILLSLGLALTGGYFWYRRQQIQSAITTP